MEWGSEEGGSRSPRCLLLLLSPTCHCSLRSSVVCPQLTWLRDGGTEKARRSAAGQQHQASRRRLMRPHSNGRQLPLEKSRSSHTHFRKINFSNFIMGKIKGKEKYLDPHFNSGRVRRLIEKMFCWLQVTQPTPHLFIVFLRFERFSLGEKKMHTCANGFGSIIYTCIIWLYMRIYNNYSL